MVDRYYNPFNTIDINVPIKFHDDCTRYCLSSGNTVVDHSPFPRMVDLWFLSLCVASRLGLEVEDITKYETRKIIEGSIFSSDPWRIPVLMMIAIAKTGDVQIVSEPRKIMTLANGLAVAGFPKIFEMLQEGGSEPIWNLSDGVNSLM